MKRLWSTHPDDLARLDSRELHQRFVVSDLFAPGEIRLAYAHDDRMVVGGAVPTGDPIELEAPTELRSGNFLDRRELALVGLDGAVSVTADGETWKVGRHDVLYLPCGTKSVTLSDTGAVYIVSAPAHRRTAARLASHDEAAALHLGSSEEANERVIRKYVHADGIESNQLVLGITTLKQGSVWNTMPAHLHDRRTEIYFYDGLGDALLVHLMGQPDSTRHLLLRDRDAVVSPPWSIHSGSGTSAYSFVWAMAGENIDYSDVDSVSSGNLR